MRINLLPICLLVLCLSFSNLKAEEAIKSLVPATDQVSDFEARRAYAELLSKEVSTLPEALENFKILQRQKPDDLKLSWQIEMAEYSLAHPESLVQGSDHSIVSKESQVSDFDAWKAYAQAISKDKNNLPEALQIFKKLFNEKPRDFKLGWEIEKTEYALAHPEENENNLSLVPKNDWISDHDARLSLARLLSYSKSTRREGLEQYYILLKENPHDPLILLEIAKIYVDETLYKQAICLLKQMVIPADSEELQLKLAQLETSLGYAKDAKTRFISLQTACKEKEKIRLDFANALMSWGDFYAAEEIYEEEKQKHPHSFEAELHMINVWVAQQRYTQAEERALDALESFPKKRKELLGRLVEIKGLQKDDFAAITYADLLLAEDPEDERSIQVKAMLLFGIQKYEEAAVLFRQLLPYPDYSEEAYLYLGKSYYKLGDFEQANAIWEAASFPAIPLYNINLKYYQAGACVLKPWFIQEILDDDPPAQELHIWAELYASDGYLTPMIDLYAIATTKDPDYFHAQFALAESLSNELDFVQPLNIYNTLLEDFPTNYKLLLNRARVVSWDRYYKCSLHLYDELIALNPSNLVPKLEQARVAYWGKYFELSMKLYSGLLEDTSGDTWAMKFLNRQISLEMKVNCLRWNKRVIHSLKYYQELQCADPGSATWKFEYAQALCSLGLCCDAMAIYSDILERDPLHTLAGMSLEREQMKTENGLYLYYNWWQEKGYGELSQVGRYEVVAGIEIPLACNHHLRFAERRYLEHTYFDGKYHSADGQTVEWDCRFNAYLQAFTSVTRKHYVNEFGTTYSGKANLLINLSDYGYLTLGFKKVDEVHNYFNLVQLTQGNIWWAGLESNINHYLTVNAVYEHEDYNDGNTLEHAMLNLECAFTEHPKVFKATITGEYRDTDKNNIFIYNPAGQLTNIIYPYWAPQDYFVGQLQLEWRHDYSFLEFCGAPLCFYDLKFSFGDDTDNNWYWEIKGEWQHEFYRNWKVGASFYIHRSDQWDGDGLWCNLDYRF